MRRYPSRKKQLSAPPWWQWVGPSIISSFITNADSVIFHRGGLGLIWVVSGSTPNTSPILTRRIRICILRHICWVPFYLTSCHNCNHIGNILASLRCFRDRPLIFWVGTVTPYLQVVITQRMLRLLPHIDENLSHIDIHSSSPLVHT